MWQHAAWRVPVWCGVFGRAGAMVHPFVSTRPRLPGRPAVLSLSVAVHAILIYAALSPRAGTIRQSGGEVFLDRAPAVERIRYIEVSPTHATVSSTARAATRTAALPTLPRIQAPSIELGEVATPTPVADIDLSSTVNAPDSAAASVARVSDVIRQIVGDPAPGAGRVGPYSKDEVDKIVAPFTNNPKPVYPWRLERQGVETSFIVQYVVDSTGRVDNETILFPMDVQAPFTESVRESLRRARFYPAQIGGHRVRQLVEQQFSFVLVGVRDRRGSR
jgi:protein TonB